MPYFYPFLLFLFRALLVIFWASLSGCAGDSQILTDSLKLTFKQGATDLSLTHVLKPEYRYLRVTIEGRVLLLVLGSVELDRRSGQKTEAWYSSNGDVIQLRGGRVVATAGTPVDWLAVRQDQLPSWNEVLNSSNYAPQRYWRERDVKFRYQFGLRESVDIHRIEEASAAQERRLSKIYSGPLAWFEERSQGLPVAVFGVQKSATLEPEVVFSKQCLSVDFCLIFQRWTLDDQRIARESFQ